MKRTFSFLWVVVVLAGCTPPVREEGARAGMTFIPAGVYTRGGKTRQASPDEFPRHRVEVKSFYMDIHEVTNAQFEEFVKATGYKTVAERTIDWEDLKKELPEGTPKPADRILQPGALVFHKTGTPVNLNDPGQWWYWVVGADWRHPEGPESSIENRMNHPVVQVAWEDAKAYAEWAGKRLPTEAEWEWAAMGGQKDAIYPWGNEPADHSASRANFWQGVFPYNNTLEDDFMTTAPVGSFPPNSYGLYDMAGNVWEWCSDWYATDSYQSCAREEVTKDPRGPAKPYDATAPYLKKKVMRGGSFLCNDSYCSGYRVSRRMGSSSDTGLNHTGFRCVKDVKETYIPK